MSQAHKVLESLEKIKRSGRFGAEVMDLIARKLTESQKFELDFGEFPVMTEKEMQKQIKDLNLPYELSYFSVPTVGGVLARDRIDDVLLQVFLSKGAEIGILPPTLVMVLDKQNGEIVAVTEDQRMLDLWHEANDPEIMAVCGLIGLVIRGLAVLNCSNVTWSDNPAPAALNKKREKAGKPPLFSFKTLQIKTGPQARTTSCASELGRLGPRLHLRRGHIRKLFGGTTTWVQSSMVGSARDGMAMKDYRVT